MIYEKKLELSKSNALTQEQIIGELRSIAFFNIKNNNIISWDANGVISYKASSEWTRAQMAAIQSIEFKWTQWGPHIKINLYDKRVH